MRVPVLDQSGKPLMPTTPSRARRWLREGKAIKKWSKLGVFHVQLVAQPSSYNKQEIVIGLDPGKMYSEGIFWGEDSPQKCRVLPSSHQSSLC